MAAVTKHTVRFSIPKTDKVAWNKYQDFVEYLHEKDYLDQDGFTHEQKTQSPKEAKSS